MDHCVIGVFNSRGDAELAEKNLVAYGIEPGLLRYVTARDLRPGRTGQRTLGGELPPGEQVAECLDPDDGDHDEQGLAQDYLDAVRHGATLLIVSVQHDAEAQLAEDFLSLDGSVGLGALQRRRHADSGPRVGRRVGRRVTTDKA